MVMHLRSWVFICTHLASGFSLSLKAINHEVLIYVIVLMFSNSIFSSLLYYNIASRFSQRHSTRYVGKYIHFYIYILQCTKKGETLGYRLGLPLNDILLLSVSLFKFRVNLIMRPIVLYFEIILFP